MTETVIVTGCAGFIGSHLTDRLLAEGRTVVGIDSFEDYYARETKEANLARARSHPTFKLHEASILDIDLRALLAGSACVYHLAAQAGVRASWGESFDVYTRNNVLATQRLLEACAAAEVPKVIYASSSSVYGDQRELPLTEGMAPRPRSPYGVTKLAGEHLCVLYHANYGLDAVALRFFTVYGPRQRPDMAIQRLLHAALDGTPFPQYGDGSQIRDFTYVGDVVRANIAAAFAPNLTPGRVFNVCGGSAVTLTAVLNTLRDIAGKPLRITHTGEKAGDVFQTGGSSDAARDALGWSPRTDLASGLRAQWQATNDELPV